MQTGTSTLTKNQKRTLWASYKGAPIQAEVRYDDECGNGHNTFAVTGTLYGKERQRGTKAIKRDGGAWWPSAAGCLHDEIGEAFPELRHLLKWHLTSSDGPMHYIQNTIFLAETADCWGKKKGEPRQWGRVVAFDCSPIRWRGRNNGDFINWLDGASGADFELIRIDHEKEPKMFGPKWTLGGAPDRWYQCPFDSEAEGLEFLGAMRRGWKIERVPSVWGTGKERELDAARCAACWPEATDEDLTAPGLKERLEARLPALMAEFRQDIEAAGFVW
jgi:hypothetical protein